MTDNRIAAEADVVTRLSPQAGTGEGRVAAVADLAGSLAGINLLTGALVASRGEPS